MDKSRSHEKKAKQFKQYRVNLHILSPIHIGTGQELDPFSYVIKNETLYLIDLLKWMEDYPNRDELYSKIRTTHDSFLVT